MPLKFQAIVGIIAVALCAGVAAQDNPDLAVTDPTVIDQKPKSVTLEPVESINIPEPKNALNKNYLIKRIHVYKAAQTEDVLYLMAEMCLFGGEEPVPHVVGVFWGYRYEKDEDFLTPEDLDGDGWPELMLKHRTGADEYCLRVFRIFQEGNRTDRDSCISVSRMVRQVGCLNSAMGAFSVNNGVIVETELDEERQNPKTLHRYVLKKGEDKLTEVK